jgi:hypothetical protein
MQKYAKSEKGRANRRRYYRENGRVVLERFWASEKGSIRRRFIEWLKDQPCFDCGRCFPACAMDFDHVRGEKWRDVSRLKGASFETITAEVQKCDVVCANCHRVRTWARKRRMH